MRLIAALVGIACVAVVACGCGGGGEDTIAKAEYLEQGNAICAKGIAKRAAAVNAAVEAQGGGGKPVNGLDAQLVTEAALPPIAQMTDELEELDDPASGADEAAAVAAAFREVIEEVEAEPARAVKANDPYGEANAKSAAFGLNVCSKV